MTGKACDVARMTRLAKDVDERHGQAMNSIEERFENRLAALESKVQSLLKAAEPASKK